MHRIKLSVILGMICVAASLVVFRIYSAIVDLAKGDQTAVLAVPLTVILPGLAFAFLTTRRGMASREGALMQMGALIQLLLIVALPGFALYLALGFPIVFLFVELFETKMPVTVKTSITRRLLA